VLLLLLLLVRARVPDRLPTPGAMLEILVCPTVVAAAFVPQDVVNTRAPAGIVGLG
jgi:hypothetical protein